MSLTFIPTKAGGAGTQAMQQPAMSAQAQLMQQDALYKMLATRMATAPTSEKAYFLRTLENSPAINPTDQQNLIAEIRTGKSSVRCFDITVIVPLDKTTVKVFDASRNLDLGLTSLRNAQLDAGRFFVPQYIRLFVGSVDSNATPVNGFLPKNDILATNFGDITQGGFANLRNGFMRLWVDGQKLLDNFGIDNFNNTGDSNRKQGEFELPESIVIPPNKEIKCELEMATIAELGTLQNPHLKFVMRGLATVPGA